MQGLLAVVREQLVVAQEDLEDMRSNLDRSQVGAMLLSKCSVLKT